MDPATTSDRFDVVNEIFSDALELPESERKAFVEQRCASSPSCAKSIFNLLSRFERIGDDFKPLISNAAGLGFDTGDVISKQYRLAEKLGEGGMGIVYRADDLDLLSSVALKFIRPLWQSDPSLRERFRQEILLARGISHPNVCKVFNRGSEKRPDGVEVVFAVMEHLTGETLQQRLRQGALPLSELLAVARDVAAGLDAAHREGLIHRDLKPANIMLTPGRAVIMDFGLARLSEPVTLEGQTQPGGLVGTPQYMSPEQLISDPLTGATDIYSLGLIVYEMLMGCKPFTTSNPSRLAVQRTSRDPLPFLRAPRGVPRHWPRVITRAVARNPEDRFPTASAFVAALDRTPVFQPRLPVLTRRTWVAGGISFAAVSLSTAFYRYLDRTSLPGAPVMMVMPIQDAGVGPTVTGALDLLIARQLDQSAHVSVLGRRDIQSAWQRMHPDKAVSDLNLSSLGVATARDLAKRAGAHFLLIGEAAKFFDHHVLHLNLDRLGSSPDSPRSSWPNAFSVSAASDLASATFEGVNWIRAKLGESQREMEFSSRRPEELTTTNWQALQEVGTSEELIKKEDKVQAIAHLQYALQQDPTFAFAEARLGDLLVEQGQVDQGLKSEERAANLVRTRHLDDREALRISGIFYLDTKQSAEAEKVYSAWASKYPRDFRAYFYKASAIQDQWRPDEALHWMRKAAELNKFALHAVAIYLIVVGNLDEAAKVCRQGELFIESGQTDRIKSALAYGRGDMKACWNALERMRSCSNNRLVSDAYAYQACFRAEKKEWDAASKLLDDGIAYDRSFGLPSGHRARKLALKASHLLKQDRKEEARLIALTMLIESNSIAARKEAGCFLVRTGEISKAKACKSIDFPNWPIYNYWNARLNTEIALINSRHTEAQQQAAIASALEAFDVWPEYLSRVPAASPDAEVRLSMAQRKRGCYWLGNAKR